MPGHRVDAVVFGGSVTGRQAVGSRGELAVPAAARSPAGLEDDCAVVLVAAVDEDLLVMHAHATVAQLLAEHYAAQTAGDGDDR